MTTDLRAISRSRRSASRTAGDDDIARLANHPGARVSRTGDVFRAWTRAGARPDARPICRYIDPSTPRHVYSIDAARCASYAAQLSLISEGTAFLAVPATGGSCPTDTAPVTRWTATVNGVAYERYAADVRAATAPFTAATIAFCGAPRRAAS